MWYFTTVHIENVQDNIIEAAVRQFAVKRLTALDLQSSASYAGAEKMFLGLEKEKSLAITRIRTPFERIFPKFIIRFNKEEGFAKYKIRYSLFSFIVLLLLIFAVIANAIYIIGSNETDNAIFVSFLFLFIFFLFSFFEYRLVKARLHNAIRKVQQTSLFL